MANAFLDAYIQGDESARRQGLANVGQLNTMLQGVMNADKINHERAFRSEMAAADTPEKQVAVAVKYGGPQAVLGHADRQESTLARKESTLARIAQQASQFDQMMALRYRQETRQEAKDEITRQWQQGRLNFQAAGMRLAGERLYDETGIRLGIPEAPTLGAPGQTQPAPDPLAGRPQAERDAIALIQSGKATSALATPQGAQVVSPATPMPAPAPAPVAPPAEIPVSVPVTPASQYGAEGRFPPVAATPAPGGISPAAILPTVDEARANPVTPSVAPATPTAPQMPQFTGSPREIRQAQNKWLLAQGKAGEAGGKASENVVDAIVQGRMQMPTGFALRSPYWQDVIERVAVKDPNFDASKYAARAAARRTFSSGPEARNVTALNTVIGHLGTLDEAATALGNKDLRAFNVVANRLATELGDPRINNFDTAKQAVAEETMRVFRQVGASESEARMWGERISSSGSPAQLRGTIATLGELLDSRVKAIAQQYERTVNQEGNPARVDPRNEETLRRLRQGGNPAGSYSDPAKERRYQEWKAKNGG